MRNTLTFLTRIFQKKITSSDIVLKEINQLAKLLLLEKKEKVDKKAKIIGERLTLKEMERAVDSYLQNAVEMYPKEINYKRMGIVTRFCIAFGEDICPYIDSFAFGEYDWTQYEAIDLLCKMALINGIRKEKTLKLIDENIDDFRNESLMNSLISMKYFENEPIVQKIFERQIENSKDDFQTLVEILEIYSYSNLSRFQQYLPLIKNVIFQSDETDYSTLSMSYIMKSDENGQMAAYNQDGSRFNKDEGIESIKLRAAVIYYLIDKNDIEVKNFLKHIELYSKFENHKNYLRHHLNL